jgi:hypothetical protein
MKLNGRQITRIVDTLLSAFPSEANLRFLIRTKLDENLAEIAKGENLRLLTFDLVNWAESHNRVGDLIQGAAEENPGHTELQELLRDAERWRDVLQQLEDVTAGQPAPLRADYDWDIFVSYKRHERMIGWLTEVVEHIAYWTMQELGGRPPRVFYDKSTLDDGGRWPDNLRQAMQTSRCMVGIWSPDYFQSHWCVSEWKSFRRREMMAGVARGELIAPIRYHDGRWFPAEAAEIPPFDLSQYTYTIESFWRTPRAVELEERLKTFSQHLAAVVERAPAFDAMWPIVEDRPVPLGVQRLERL